MAIPKLTNNDPWWLGTPDKSYDRAWPLLEIYLSEQSFRLSQFLRWYRLYGNFPARGLSPTSYWRLADVASRPRHKLTLNVVKSCVDTVTSKIAKNRPKPTFLTSGGSWSQQKRAKLLDKFVWGEFYRTGVYQSTPVIFRDAACFGSGFAYVYAEPWRDSQRICVERVCPEEIFTDPMESIFGKPRAIYRRRHLTRDVLASMFPKMIDKIRTVQATSPDNQYPSSYILSNGVTKQADMITVVEAWHLPSTEVTDDMTMDDHDGRHAIFISNATLAFDEYRRDYFPFPKLDWTAPLRGFWGQGLAEELVGIQYEINRILRQIQESLPWAVPKCFIESGSDVVKDHVNDEIGGIIKFKGTPPEIKAIQSISPELFGQLDRLYRQAYEITGVSQLSAQSRKPAGVEAAVALRELNDIESERFATVTRTFDDFHLEIARQMVRIGKEIYEKDKSYSFMGRDRRYTTQLKWKDVDLDEDALVMQVMPTSGISQTPAGRLSMVQDLANLQLIPKEMQLSLLDFPDLEAVNQRSEADAEFCNMQIEKMIEDGEAQTPEPFQNLDYAIRQAQATYLLAGTMSDVSEEKKDLLRIYMETAQRMLQDSAQSAAPPPQMAPPSPQPQPQPQPQLPPPGAPPLQ